MSCIPGKCAPPETPHRTDSVDTVQEELQSMQARAQYAESRAAVAEAELQSLRKVSLHPRSTPDPKLGLVIFMQSHFAMTTSIASAMQLSLSTAAQHGELLPYTCTKLYAKESLATRA